MAAAGKGGNDQSLGRSRGGLSTKIHMVCDAQERPLRFALTGGRSADGPQAILLLSGIETGAVIADKGCESNRILTFIRPGAQQQSYRPRVTKRSPGNTTRGCTVEVI